MKPYELHNKILSLLNSCPLGLSFAQIYDSVKPGFGLESVKAVTCAVYEPACEDLISCNEVFAEASNGATRERQMLYSIAERGRTYLQGLERLKGLSSTSILDSKSIADQLAPNAEKTSGYAPVGLVVKGGGVTAPAITLPPSVISTETERVNRVMDAVNRIAVSNRELCDCGRSVTKICACGKEVCSVHWYDADGNHTLSDKDGMCGECVSAVQLQTWGESHCGIAGRQ